MSIQPDLNIPLGEESQPIEFPSGLIGLEEWQRFVLISHPAGEPLQLLQSLDDSRVSLIVADPRQIITDYHVVLSEADVRALQYTGSPGVLPSNVSHHIGIYSILSIQEEPFSVTANLIGPLVINWEAKVGRQVILSDSNYDPRYPLVDHSAQPSPNIKQQKESA